MKEKREKKKYHKKDRSKKRKTSKSKTKRKCSDSSNDSSESGEWIEKDKTNCEEREQWMSMTGMLKTYSKEDVKTVHNKESKKHIDSYNPSTSSRELNPYWRDGGSGLPESYESKSNVKQFIKPIDDDDYYTKPFRNMQTKVENSKSLHINDVNNTNRHSVNKSFNWRKEKGNSDNFEKTDESEFKHNLKINKEIISETSQTLKKDESSYLSDEKMNKLAAKIVKAEIMGDSKLVNKLKVKLEAAREFRKQNPEARKHEINDEIMLISTTSSGNSRPLTKPNSHVGDSRSYGGKRKAETHNSKQRVKYFGNDDRYNLSQMFEQEKYGSNFDQDAELAAVAAKHKNPNDDLEDIFVDEISKNKNVTRDNEREKQHAINQSIKLDRSLEGCEYCIDSKNMLKHLIVSFGSKVYLALPAKKSLVKGQCIITTQQHSSCVTSVDEDVWEEIQNYRKIITQFFNLQNKDVVFFETATKLHRYPHMVINCVPLPRDIGDMASIYFKKALLECEAEWSMNKKVVDLKGKNIRRGVPKGLPYFWVDFGMDPGFAHVIEDQQLFPNTFAEEVIGGILDLNHNLWKNPHKEYGDLQRKKVLEFVKDWKPYEMSMKNQT